MQSSVARGQAGSGSARYWMLSERESCIHICWPESQNCLDKNAAVECRSENCIVNVVPADCDCIRAWLPLRQGLCN